MRLPHPRPLLAHLTHLAEQALQRADHLNPGQGRARRNARAGAAAATAERRAHEAEAQARAGHPHAASR